MLRLMDSVAPALLVAQAIGRLGNYFNQELFGKPTTLPWGLRIDPSHRPPRYTQFATFQPTFLYELVWNLALAGVLAWLVRSRCVRPPGVFLGMRLKFWIATLVSLAGLLWFLVVQRDWVVAVRAPRTRMCSKTSTASTDATAADKGPVLQTPSRSG
jgi:hypothetical protein